jgi:aminopeptidase N
VIRAALLALLLARAAAAAPTPRSYDLTLLPDAARQTFSGHETIELELDRPTRLVRMDARGLEVTSAAAIVEGRRLPARASVADGTLELCFAAALPRGRVLLELGWHGRMSRTPHGLYVAEAEGDRDVFTQLEPSAAREVFPCFDVPSLRARFVLRVVIDAAEDAISNAPVASSALSLDGRTKTVVFLATPPLPTYLVSLAVGRFDEVAAHAGAVPVRVLAPPGHHPEAAAALAGAVELLGALEGYLGVPFPFAKLDIVAVPNLAPHAMENAGAIFVRADELLVEGEGPARRRRAHRLAHELAHQWFGDLVTMASWNDLWLSEGLARWAEFEILDRVHADWRTRDQFRAMRDRAIALDAGDGAHAIRPVGHEDHPAFDLITYDKGAATLRMLQVWMGDDAFRAALRRYLHRRAWGAASSEDFWTALGGPQLSQMARGWFERRGHPRLSLDLRCEDGAADVHLRQEAPAGAPRGRWSLPLVLRTPTTTLHLIMQHESAVLRLREPSGCPSRVELEDEAELPFAVRRASNGPVVGSRR